MAKLTPKQQAFVQEYILDFNATQAAIRAGYSKKTASSQGERLLRNVEVSKALQNAQEERAKKLERTAEDVLKDIRSLQERARNNDDIKTELKALEIEGRFIGMDKQKIDLSNSDGSLSPMDITVTFDVTHAGKA